MEKNIRSKIIDVASYLPDKILTNHDLEKLVETNDEWIIQRTGITQRYIAKDQSTADMATKAAEKLLQKHPEYRDKIDAIIVATTTPDKVFPSVACMVQRHLNCRSFKNDGKGDISQIKSDECFKSEDEGVYKQVHDRIGDLQKREGSFKNEECYGAAFDIQAVCSGFLYGLTICNALIKIGQFKNILLIGAESMSRIVNWQDRSTCILFGDGAGAAMISASIEGESDIIDTSISADGNLSDILYTTGGLSEDEKSFIVMNGKEVFKNAVEKMSNSCLELLKKNGLTVEDIDFFVPHQANVRIIEAVGKRMDMPAEKVIITVDKHANTSAASIPLALSELADSGRLKRSHKILVTALGAGLTWGSAIIRW